VSSFDFHYPKDTTLSCRPDYSCHLESQSIDIAYDEIIIAKQSIGKMGYIALAI